MIAEALDKLIQMAHRTGAPTTLDMGDPRCVSYVVGGVVQTAERPPAPRDHHVDSLTDLVELANRFATTPDPTGTNLFNPVVWYDERQVVLVIDDMGHRIERATFKLQPSAPFTCLERLEAGKTWHNQKAFVRLLRVELACLPPVSLLNMVRRVKFENGSTVTRSLRSQEESLGKELVSRVETEGRELPEEVVIHFDVYRNYYLPDTRPVRCSVEVEPLEGTFRLMPFPDALFDAVKSTLVDIGGNLVESLKGVPAYHGRP